LFNYQGTCRIYQRRFIYYIILVSLSTLFSNFFEKLFWRFLMTFVIGENFLILLLKLFLVNIFFKLFLKYFLTFFDDFCLKRELSYLTMDMTTLSISFLTFFVGKIKNYICGTSRMPSTITKSFVILFQVKWESKSMIWFFELMQMLFILKIYFVRIIAIVVFFFAATPFNKRKPYNLKGRPMVAPTVHINIHSLFSYVSTT